MQLWQYIAGLLILFGLFLIWIRERRLHRLFAGIPTYPLLPFIGNMHQFFMFGDGKVLFRQMVRASEVCEKSDHGRMVIWLGSIPFFVTQEPDDVKCITNAFVEKAYMYSFGKMWLGEGLVTAPGATWKQNIKKLAATFNTSIVDGYLEVFNTQAQKLVDKLKMEVGRKPFDIIDKYLAYITLETICQTALGVPEISENIVTTEYYAAFNRGLELLIARGLNVLMHPDFIYKLTPAYQEMKKCVSVIHQVSDTVLRKRQHERDIERRTKKSSKVKEDNDAEETKFRAFLDILLDLKEVDPSLTEQQIKSEVDTIIVGGQETVATTMYFTFLMIGCKNRIQDKLFAELKTIFGDSNRPVVKEDFNKMKYLEAVINETLRLFPPLPGVMRYADRDLQLNSLKLPKGTNCAINAWGAGRSVRIWGKDAALYRPERWLQEQPPGKAASFLAFSYGRRACLGKKYAMAILKTVIAHCVRELEFISNADKLELKVDIALRPISGHLIQVRRRK